MKTATLQFIFTILGVVLASEVFAQSPGIDWQNTIGGSNSEGRTVLEQTTDGGYILGGSSTSGISGNKTIASFGNQDYWIVKLNSFGTIEWQKAFGGNQDDYLNSIHQTSDGGYIIGGYTYSDISGNKTEAKIGGTDFWIIKVNSVGAIEWQQVIGGNDNDRCTQVRQTAEGGYIAGGYSVSPASGDKTEGCWGEGIFHDYWVVKLSSTGDVEWDNTIGSTKTDELNDISQTADGGYILAGKSESNNKGDKTEKSLGDFDYWVVKLNSTGNLVEWQNTIGGSQEDVPLLVKEAQDGGYILGGYSASPVSGDKTEGGIGNEFWIVKISNTGTVEWDNSIGGNGDDVCNDIALTFDGGYILGGQSNSGVSGDKTAPSFGEMDYWIVKLEQNGTIKWDKTIGGNDWDELHAIQQTSDGEFIAAGASSSGISGNKFQESFGSSDFWVLKIYEEDCDGFTVYADEDEDGFGDPANTVFVSNCVIPSGYVTNNGDCNDANASVSPSATEVCANSIDDNCDQQVDELLPPVNLIAGDITVSSVKLQWDAAHLATSYKVRYKVKNTSGWTTVNASATEKNLSGLSPATAYSWQVKSKCGNNPPVTSAWSLKKSFTTDPLKITMLPAQTILEIYPNPASALVSLKLTVSNSQKMSIKVFDVNGKEMATWFNGQMIEGDHEFSLDVSSFSKGIYFVRMVSENRIQNEKLIVQ